MSDPEEISPTEARERLEHEADAVRARLIDKLDTLNERRHHVGHAVSVLREQASRHRPLLIGVGVGAVVLFSVVALTRRARQRREQRRDLILNAAARALGSGYVVQPARKPGLISRGVKKAGGALLSLAAHELRRRALAELSGVTLALRGR